MSKEAGVSNSMFVTANETTCVHTIPNYRPSEFTHPITTLKGPISTDLLRLSNIEPKGPFGCRQGTYSARRFNSIPGKWNVKT